MAKVERTEVKIRIRYEGGDADQNRLQLYDGAESIFGFAKTIQLASYAFSAGSISKHATSTGLSQIYLLPSRTGSFIETFQLFVTSPEFLSGLGAGTIQNAFYDFLKVVLKKAVGQVFQPQESRIEAFLERDEPFFDELADVLEGPLVAAHRTVERSGGTISIERPRSSLVTLDSETLEWVKTRDADESVRTFTGYVTRFNVISKNGRMYDPDEDRTIPFKPEESLSEISKHLLSWSLDQRNNGLPALLDFDVKRILSARGVTKRFVLVRCRKPGSLAHVRPS